MTNPFTTATARATSTVETLPPSLPALFVLVIVGTVDIVSLVLYGVLTYQQKNTGQLDSIILTSSTALLASLARLSGSQPVAPAPTTDVAPQPAPPMPWLDEHDRLTPGGPP